MKKKDLVSFKHLLVTRDKQVYWYIGDEIKPGYNMVACGTEIDRDLNDTWDNKLLAKRDGSLYGEPRSFDIIYVYEITVVNKWFEIFHKIKHIDFEEHIRKQYSYESFVRQVYERIDGGLN